MGLVYIAISHTCYVCNIDIIIYMTASCYISDVSEDSVIDCDNHYTVRSHDPHTGWHQHRSQ